MRHCHVAQAAQMLMGQDELKLSAVGNVDAFVPKAEFVSAKDFAATTSPENQAAGFNVHMLSYKGSSLFIGQRVINETASVITYLNGTVIPQ